MLQFCLFVVVLSEEHVGSSCTPGLFSLAFMIPQRGFFAPLAKACLTPLLMLYHEGGRLNGQGSPAGIETMVASNTLHSYRSANRREKPA